MKNVVWLILKDSPTPFCHKIQIYSIWSFTHGFSLQITPLEIVIWCELKRIKMPLFWRFIFLATRTIFFILNYHTFSWNVLESFVCEKLDWMRKSLNNDQNNSSGQIMNEDRYYIVFPLRPLHGWIRHFSIRKPLLLPIEIEIFVQLSVFPSHPSTALPMTVITMKDYHQRYVQKIKCHFIYV